MPSIPEHLVDKRVVQRNVQRGLLDKRDYDTYLKELPDSSQNMDVVRLDGSQEQTAPEQE